MGFERRIIFSSFSENLGGEGRAFRLACETFASPRRFLLSHLNSIFRHPTRFRVCKQRAFGLMAAFTLVSGAQADDVPWSGTVTATGPGGDDVKLMGTSDVTLSGPATIVEDSIANVSGLPSIILNLNSLGGTLRTLEAGVTTLATANNQSLFVMGDANFRPGLLSTGSFQNVHLVKNGGTGELILDQPNSDAGALTGAFLRVVDGTLSIVGGGGDLSPIFTLENALQIDGANGKLRLGSSGALATTFVDNVLANESGTLEHTSSGTDTLAGGVTVGIGKTLTAAITAGGLNVTGTLSGPAIAKTGAGQLKFSGTSELTSLTVSGGRLEFSGPLRLASVSPTMIANGATLALTVLPADGTNVLPVGTLTVQTGTLEIVPGSLGATSNPISLTGGTLKLASASQLNYAISASGSSGIEVGVPASQVNTVTLAAQNTTLTKSGGQLTLNTLALSGTATYTLGVTGDALQISAITGGPSATLNKTGAGTLNLNGPQTYAALNASGGVTNVNGAFGPSATVTTSATLNFSTSQTIAALNIGAGGVVTLSATPGFAEGGIGGAVVPEPGALSLLALGVLGTLARRRR